jgi:hypothetical protein
MIDILKVADGCMDTGELIGEINAAKASRAKVFTTQVTFEEHQGMCVFITTSKDIHLTLGQLSSKGQQNLGSVIIRALDIEETHMGLISFPDDKGSMLATLTTHGDTYSIQLSPAH